MIGEMFLWKETKSAANINLNLINEMKWLTRISFSLN